MKAIDILIDEAREDYYPMGNTPGFPVFHKDRGIYRKSTRENLAKDLTGEAENRWPEYAFKIATMLSRIRVSVRDPETQEELDWFVLSGREMTDDLAVVESPEGIFQEHLEEFLQIAKRLM